MQTQTTKPQQMSMMATLQTVRYLVDWRGENSARFNSSVSRPGKLFYGLNLLFFLNACGGANKFLVVKTTDLSSRSFLANAEPPNAEPPIVTLAERSLTFAVNRPGEGATHTLFVDLSRYVAVFATAPPVWRVEGTLPPGLSLDTATGILIGSPIVESSDTPLAFTIKATHGDSIITSFQIEVRARLRSPGLDAAAQQIPVLVEGTASAETLAGGSGDDELEGKGGGDVIDGGGGFDFVSYRSSPQAVSIDLYYAALLQSDVKVNRLFTREQAATLGDAAGDELRNIEGIIGSSHNDSLSGNDSDNVIYGLEGQDQIKGRAGRDSLYGGPGIDFLDGGPGPDLLDGGEGGHDTAEYDHSPEGVYVNLQLGIGRFGDAEGDRLINIENLIGSDHADTLIGDKENNLITGGSGNDKIDGGGGTDRLKGGDGDDLLVDGPDGDAMWGGDGNDRFDISDTQPGQTNDLATDMIYDYEQGETLIIAPNQGTVWYRKVSGDPKFGGNKYIYVFNSAEAVVENIYVRLRNFEGTIDASVFISDGIDQVELIQLPDIT